ncbi:MAG: N-6 DNA methylase [Chitinophagales bacterium]
MQKTMLFPIEEKKDALSFFKDLYYHLYSNSNVSRQEQIIEDLSKILLYALSPKKNKEVENLSGSFIFNYLKCEYANLKNLISPFVLNDDSINFSLHKINSLSFGENPSIVIGEAFQALIGPVLRGDKGQFFTPKSVVHFMVSIIGLEEDELVCDPAAGTGGFLSETLSQSKKKVKVIGLEKDQFLAKLSSSIFEITHPNKFEFHNINSLDLAYLEKQNLLGKFDKIVTNPPFGSKIGVKDATILKNFDLGHIWTFIKSDKKWVKTNKLLREQSPQVLFIELCIKLLKDGGKAAIVLPEGVFGNKSLGYLWDYLRQHITVTELVDCPRTTFQPGTDTKTNILFFRKTSKNNQKKTSFKIGIAHHCGHNKRGSFVNPDGSPIQNDFKILSDSYYNGKKNWLEGIVKDPYYLVPRYCINNIENQFNDSNFDLKEFCSIGDLIENKYLQIRKGNEVGSAAYGTGLIPFVRTSDIANLEINADPTKSVNIQYFEKYKKIQNIKFGDILFVSDGRYRIGRSAIILDDKAECVIQSHLKIVKILDDSLLSAFDLLYLLNHRFVKQQITNLIFIQSTLGSVGNRLKEIKLPIPVKNEKWNTLIEEFKNVLIERNRLLQKLKQYQVGE